MKVELFPFQKIALAKLRMNAATALGNYRSTHTPQVVSYTAPTGAGKTIIMAALVEAIYFRDKVARCSSIDELNHIFDSDGSFM